MEALKERSVAERESRNPDVVVIERRNQGRESSNETSKEDPVWLFQKQLPIAALLQLFRL